LLTSVIKKMQDAITKPRPEIVQEGEEASQYRWRVAPRFLDALFFDEVGRSLVLRWLLAMGFARNCPCSAGR
jgi:hypothetical protein